MTTGFSLNFSGLYFGDDAKRGGQMSRYIERRAGPRIGHKAPLKIKSIKTGVFSNARIVNYCDNGLYFESNSVLNAGAEIIIGIEDSPFSYGADVFDVYRAKILWHRPVKSTFYSFGYGVQLISTHPINKRRVNDETDRRKYPRWNCNQSACFCSQNQLYKGVVKNVGPNGLFIETHKTLPVGRLIELKVLDRKTDTLKLLRGEIVRSGPEGVGVRVKKIADLNAENAI